MHRRLFEVLLESGAESPKRRGYTLPVSIAVHAVALSAVVVVPLFSSGELPEPAISCFLPEPVFAAPPPPPPPPPPAGTSRLSPKPVPRIAEVKLTQPAVIPDALPKEDSALGESSGTDRGVEGGEEGGMDGGVIGSMTTSLDPVFSDPPPVEPVRVGGRIRPPTKITHVDPAYPPIAKAARVQGIVILECTIDPSGRVHDVTVLRGVPLLDQAAVEAVRQWRYTPTQLNGVAVPVIMTVTVRFGLS